MFTKILRLIPYELNKAVSAPFIRLTAILLLAVNIVMCAYYYESSYSKSEKMYEDAVYQLYVDDSDEFYSEYDRIKKEYAELDYFVDKEPSKFYGGGKYYDISLFDSVYSIITADESYHERMKSIVRTAEDIRDSYKEMGKTDSFIYRYESAEAKLYADLDRSVKLSGSQVEGWREYFEYRAEFFPAMILVAVICVYIATEDRSNGFHFISMICKNGRTPDVAAKFGSAMILSAAVTVIFTFSSFVTVGFFAGGYSDFTEAVQAVYAQTGVMPFELFPLKINMLGAAASGLILKIASSLIFCAVVFLLSSVIKNSAISLGAGALVVVGCYFGFELTEPVFSGQWRYLDIWSVYDLSTFAGHYRAVDLLGQSVNIAYILAIIAVLAATAALIVSCAVCSVKVVRMRQRRKNVFSRVKAILSGKRKPRGCTSLMFYEFYKQKPLILLLGAVVVIKLFVSAGYYSPEYTRYDDVLREYIYKIGGEYTKEKAQFIKDEYEECLESVDMFDTVEKDYWQGLISDEYFSRLYEQYKESSSKLPVLEDLSERSDYLDNLYSLRGIRGSYLYDSGYYMLVSQGTDFIAIVFIVVFCCRSYICELSPSGGGVTLISGATERGRAYLFRIKLLSCTLTALLIKILSMIIDVCLFARSYELPKDLSARLLSMPRYGNTAVNFTVGGYLVFCAVLSLIGTAMIAAICLCLTVWLRRALLVYSVSAAAVFIPYFIIRSGVTAAGYIDVAVLSDFDRLYIMSPPFWWAIFFPAAALLTVLTVILTDRRVARTVIK